MDEFKGWLDRRARKRPFPLSANEEWKGDGKRGAFLPQKLTLSLFFLNREMQVRQQITAKVGLLQFMIIFLTVSIILSKYMGREKQPSEKAHLAEFLRQMNSLYSAWNIRLFCFVVAIHSSLAKHPCAGKEPIFSLNTTFLLTRGPITSQNYWNR